MAGVLGTTPEFLLDNKRTLVLTSTERFAQNAESPDSAVDEGVSLLTLTKKVFTTPNGLSSNDKRALFSCMSEIYFDAKNRDNEQKSDT
jgi:hypothetical protein